jgi:hypothetical protein
LSQAGCQTKRSRPFKRIIKGNSDRDDGIQLADMIAGTVRHYFMGDKDNYYYAISDKIVDLWKVPNRGK